MFGANLLETIVGGLAAMAISFLGGAVYSNAYGPNAWKLAEARAALAQTNNALKQLQAEDDAISAREKAEDAEADAAFSKVAPGLKKCVLDKAQVEALNKIGGQ
jgi:hypothetical protein